MDSVIRSNASVVLPGAETNISGRCLFVVGDAKIILALSNGIERLVSFGQVSKMRQWEVQGQDGVSFNDSFTIAGCDSLCACPVEETSQPSQSRNSTQLSKPDGDT